MKHSDLNAILPAEVAAAGYRVVGLVGGPEFATNLKYFPRLDISKLTPATAEKLVAMRFPYLVFTPPAEAEPGIAIGKRSRALTLPVAEGE